MKGAAGTEQATLLGGVGQQNGLERPAAACSAVGVGVGFSAVLPHKATTVTFVVFLTSLPSSA